MKKQVEANSFLAQIVDLCSLSMTIESGHYTKWNSPHCWYIHNMSCDWSCMWKTVGGVMNVNKVDIYLNLLPLEKKN